MRKPNFEGISAKKMCIQESSCRSSNSLPRLVRFPAFWCVLGKKTEMSVCKKKDGHLIKETTVKVQFPSPQLLFFISADRFNYLCIIPHCLQSNVCQI